MPDMFIYLLLFIYRTPDIIGQRGVGMYGCCGGRAFLTREEKIEMLEEYKQGLKQEAAGVEERIKELKKQN